MSKYIHKQLFTSYFLKLLTVKTFLPLKHTVKTFDFLVLSFTWSKISGLLPDSAREKIRFLLKIDKTSLTFQEMIVTCGNRPFLNPFSIRILVSSEISDAFLIFSIMKSGLILFSNIAISICMDPKSEKLIFPDQKSYQMMP